MNYCHPSKTIVRYNRKEQKIWFCVKCRTWGAYKGSLSYIKGFTLLNNFLNNTIPIPDRKVLKRADRSPWKRKEEALHAQDTSK